MTPRFALLDRDGTINEERHHLASADEVELIPGAAAAIVKLRDLGLGIVVVTNQAEVGRGNLDIAELDRIHERMSALLADHGATVDAIEVCPHRPEDVCDCRKPKPGMALRAAARLGFAPDATVVVGDHLADLGMGRAIGGTTILVRTGHGAEAEADADGLADHVADDLPGAVAIIAGLVGKE